MGRIPRAGGSRDTRGEWRLRELARPRSQTTGTGVVGEDGEVLPEYAPLVHSHKTDDPDLAEVSRFQGGTQSIPSGADTRVLFAQQDMISDVATYDAGTWTLNRGGLWSLDASIRMASSSGSGTDLIIAPASGTTVTRYATGWIPATGGRAGNVSCSRRFTAGSQVSLWLWHSAGAAVNTDPAFQGNRFALCWQRP